MFPHSNLPCVFPRMQLTDLQSLKGVFGATRYVLGCISRSEDGRYVLEDASGSVPLDLAAAETAAGFYTGGWLVHGRAAAARSPGRGLGQGREVWGESPRSGKGTETVTVSLQERGEGRLSLGQAMG